MCRSFYGRAAGGSGRRIPRRGGTGDGRRLQLAAGARRLQAIARGPGEEKGWSAMKAVQFDTFGDPAEVLHVAEVPKPEPGPGQVRVRMIASPINPSDLLTVRGLYGARPPLPATPGFEGVGVVEARGPGILGRLRFGKRVAVLNNKTGNWAEYAILPARQVVPVPDD